MRSESKNSNVPKAKHKKYRNESGPNTASSSGRLAGWEKGKGLCAFLMGTTPSGVLLLVFRAPQEREPHLNISSNGRDLIIPRRNFALCATFPSRNSAI